jgi:hypothetical protein
MVPAQLVLAYSTELKKTWQNTGPSPFTRTWIVALVGPVAVALSTSTTGLPGGGPGGGEVGVGFFVVVPGESVPVAGLVPSGSAPEVGEAPMVMVLGAGGTDSVVVVATVAGGREMAATGAGGW